MRRPLLALLLSLAAHALAAAATAGALWLTRVEPTARVRPRPIALRPVSARQWERNRGRRPEERPTGQVVDVAPGNLVRPKDSKYLAETDNSVSKQTRAREQTSRYRVAAPKTQPAPSPVGLRRMLEAMHRDDGARARPGLLTPEPSLITSDTPAEVGGAAPNDALDEAEGDQTALATREWQFAAYLNRVKQAVSAKWDPNGRLREKEPQRQLYAQRTTVLAVALRADGTLADLFVLKPCGIDALDHEAVQAFERAAPFPAPPSGLLENGYVRFQFGFTLTRENNFMPTFSGTGRR